MVLQPISKSIMANRPAEISNKVACEIVNINYTPYFRSVFMLTAHMEFIAGCVIMSNHITRDMDHF